MNGFWITVVGLGIGLASVIAANHPFSVRFLATWRLARFMAKRQVGSVPVVGYVAVNGTLENVLMMSRRGEDGEIIPGHIPVWMFEEAGETFLKELQELRIEGTPPNGRVVRVVLFELLEAEGDGTDDSGEN